MIIYIVFWLYGHLLKCYPGSSAGEMRRIQEISGDGSKRASGLRGWTGGKRPIRENSGNRGKRASGWRGISATLFHSEYVNITRCSRGILDIILCFYKLFWLFLLWARDKTQQKVPWFSYYFPGKSRDFVLVKIDKPKTVIKCNCDAIKRHVNYSYTVLNGFWYSWLALQAVEKRNRPVTSSIQSVTSSLHRSGTMTSTPLSGIKEGPRAVATQIGSSTQSCNSKLAC